MDAQSRKKKRREKSGNPGQLDFIISEPLEVKKNELYLFACEVSYFQNVLSTHRSLRTLVIIGQPGITSLNGISNLINLQELWVVECLVQDKDQIKNLGTLKRLKEITILGNPLCKRTNHYKLALQALVTLRRIDGHSVIPKDYLDD
ncbi:leucine-rich repeat-containing protein 9-like [Neodiprion fabricii]|uniref:leucine-rich repeat-containing protein 9-like n=1 Tax=Neodiprion fabricii TaxID=2872261 RepID=UPI001ED96298|nr:leucine-rich repeat-containing protein 9-like [Neodiprion fabricii]